MRVFFPGTARPCHTRFPHAGFIVPGGGVQFRLPFLYYLLIDDPASHLPGTRWHHLRRLACCLVNGVTEKHGRSGDTIWSGLPCSLWPGKASSPPPQLSLLWSRGSVSRELCGQHAFSVHSWPSVCVPNILSYRKLGYKKHLWPASFLSENVAICLFLQILLFFQQL